MIPDEPADTAQPFRGVIVCCTSIPADQRTDIANKVAELGGTHRYDLTPDVTHLVVGDYDTAKYRHVACERPDMHAMDAGWVLAVSDLWRRDAPLDPAALEARWRLRALETCGGSPRGSLLICLTGFDLAERSLLAALIVECGATYTPDLSRKVTHLIAKTASGKKYEAALAWGGIRPVTVEWLTASAERGMILDEKCFDPRLPLEKIGRGAWNRKAPGKRAANSALTEGAGREDARGGGARKLRRTASARVLGTGAEEGMWGEILQGQALQRQPQQQQPQQTEMTESIARSEDVSFASTSPVTDPNPLPSGIFSDCAFKIAGFAPPRHAILARTIDSLAGVVCDTLDDSHAPPPPPLPSPPLARLSRHRFLVVPQDSRPDTRPEHIPSGVLVVTEFFVERCLHGHRLFDPANHVLGRPFSRFPIPELDRLVICTAGFTGVELHHVSRAVVQLGATFEGRFGSGVGVLVVAKSLAAVRPEKLQLALAWDVPVVAEAWLWECIRTGTRPPLDRFMFAELGQSQQRTQQRMKQQQADPAQSASFVTAPTRQTSPALAETSSGALNRARQQRPGDVSPAAGTKSPHERHKRKEKTEKQDKQETLETLEKQETQKKQRKQETQKKQEKRETQKKQEKRETQKKQEKQEKQETQETQEKQNKQDEHDKHDKQDKIDQSDREQRQRRERAALSAKLSSLVDSATASFASAVSNAAATTTTPHPDDESAATSRPPRRRRQQKILGRAASNVSVASSASAATAERGGLEEEEAAAAVGEKAGEAMGGSGAAAAAKAAAEVKGRDDADIGQRRQQQQQPSTQLCYRDDDARESRAAALKLILGGDGGLGQKGTDMVAEVAAAKLSDFAAPRGAGRTRRAR